LNPGTQLMLTLTCLILLGACSGGSPSETPALPAGRPIEESKMVWPEFDSVEPAQAVEGTTVKIQGHGGYLLRDAEGSTLYDESYRAFKLYFDDEEIGELACFVNRCESEFVVASGVEPGEHAISTEGGATIQIEIIGD